MKKAIFVQRTFRETDYIGSKTISLLKKYNLSYEGIITFDDLLLKPKNYYDLIIIQRECDIERVKGLAKYIGLSNFHAIDNKIVIYLDSKTRCTLCLNKDLIPVSLPTNITQTHINGVNLSSAFAKYRWELLLNSAGLTLDENANSFEELGYSLVTFNNYIITGIKNQDYTFSAFNQQKKIDD